ncbi:NitrOD5 domain-containing protein [Thermococcus celericrescens]|uniref:NitrOD5 domain-containing protein n=1 Tax=Thermococcus celericrescens TaxID=227598 RepID=UPI0009FAD7DB|nr:NitrOD5 domain-containing protein [Thermococcus celericrescens]
MAKLRVGPALVSATTKEILQKLGKPFEATITAYLNSKYGRGIEIIEDNPRTFYNALKELFGEFAARVFIYDLVKELNLPIESKDIEEMIKALEEYLGEQTWPRK